MQTRSSASTDLVPFRAQTPAAHRREAQLQIVDPITFRGKILPGWTVVSQPRSPDSSSNGIVDTYFIEPGTGRQFSSLESVHKHLTGEVEERRVTRAGKVYREETRAYEGSRTKEDHRKMEFSSKGFRLPKGWSVEKYPRKNSHQIDKYYVERKTGKRFRSLVSVERYLKESGNRTLKEDGNRSDHQLMVIQYHRGHSKDFRLPDGWVIEKKPRKNSSHIDRSYVEPGTGRKFRSMAAVERYLEAAGNGRVDSDSMVQSKTLALVMSPIQTEAMDPNPPEKVKWVLTGPGGNMFSAHVSGSNVSSSLKQQWSEAFVSSIQDRS